MSETEIHECPACFRKWERPKSDPSPVLPIVERHTIPGTDEVCQGVAGMAEDD